MDAWVSATRKVAAGAGMVATGLWATVLLPAAGGSLGAVAAATATLAAALGRARIGAAAVFFLLTAVAGVYAVAFLALSGMGPTREPWGAHGELFWLPLGVVTAASAAVATLRS